MSDFNIAPKDRCYTVANENLDGLQERLSRYFYIKEVDSRRDVSDCKDFAEEKNKNFFFVSDTNLNNSNNSFTYKCYVPKNETAFTETLNFLLSPAKSFFDPIFGISYETYSEISQNLTLSGDNYLDQYENTINTNSDLSQCFKYDNDYFAKTNSFILYDLSLNSELQDLIMTTETESYNTLIEEFNSKFLDTDKFYNDKLDGIKREFTKYIETNNSTHKDNYNEKLDILASYYNTCFTFLNKISENISTISQVTQVSTHHINNIHEEINGLKRSLRNKIGLDSGNNGKLSDTRFLKNLKIAEINVLIIIIIMAIYIYSKKK